jgi:hypothetical protein
VAAPRSIALTCDGTDHTSARPLWAWQANPLALAITFAADLELLTGAATFACQIHTTAVAEGATPLASTSIAYDADGGTFEFDTADMSFAITGASDICYLFITALDAGGDELQTLCARRIEIKAATHSFEDVSPAATNAIVRLTSATPDADGLHTFTALGKTWRAPLIDFQTAP